MPLYAARTPTLPVSLGCYSGEAPPRSGCCVACRINAALEPGPNGGTGNEAETPSESNVWSGNFDLMRKRLLRAA
jgi:hypothetical protein